MSSICVDSYCVKDYVDKLPTDFLHERPPFWVVATNHATNHRSTYHWFAVSNPTATSVLLFARNYDHFRKHFEKVALKKLRDEGFTECYNAPTLVYQGDACSRWTPAPTEPPSMTPTHSEDYHVKENHLRHEIQRQRF